MYNTTTNRSRISPIISGDGMIIPPKLVKIDKLFAIMELTTKKLYYGVRAYLFHKNFSCEGQSLFHLMYMGSEPTKKEQTQ